ncbi:peptidoglycan editing factor PgeF [Atopococcus tabaci]|uniref:peptidoglycan editing factor PgeF n=1 Tax=Atopococcus tabaci TaxID=269774 RepID=UPI00240A7C5E|nr:peptidoglycan editing factor PgeF [Atopococcus tabaci]
MHSSLLEEHGLITYVAGMDYNFRYQTAGKKVVEDVEKLVKHLGVSPQKIYTGQQTHGANVEYCDGVNGEEFAFGRTFKETDGLMTDKEGIALLIKYADCTPIVFFDPIHRVHASVHSGWRGTVQRIAVAAMEKMEREFGTKREELLVFVGPSIDQANYEVGPEVYEAFSGFKHRDTYFKPDGEKFRLSMTDANVSILREVGIKDEQMDVCRESTYTSDRLHSARKEGKAYQLNGLFTMLK